jgi:hypothetical protein
MKSTISLITVLCMALAGILFFGAPAFSEDQLALGDVDQDYVYTPVKPCRIVDTRAVGGPFSASETRDYYVYGEVAAQQGGASAGYPERCNAPKGEPRAVHINVTSTNAHASGWFTVWNYNGNKPAASMVNYTPGLNIANQGTIKTNPKAAEKDISVYSEKDADLVIDVLGYYYAEDPIFLDSNARSGAAPYPVQAHTRFLAQPAIVEITRNNQKIFVDSTNLFCSTWDWGTGASDLGLWICYQDNDANAFDGITKVGEGIGDVFAPDASAAPWQGIPMGMSTIISEGLEKGKSYKVGLCGEAPRDFDAWQGCHAPRGYTTAFVFPD